VVVGLGSPDGHDDGGDRRDTSRQHIAADLLIGQRALAAFCIAFYQHPQAAAFDPLPVFGQTFSVVLGG
jgi:hypothetical protein